MNVALVLAAIAGLAWALNIVSVRWALVRTEASSLTGAWVGIVVAAVVTVVGAFVAGGPLPSNDDLWRFAVVGAIAPGSSQALFVAAIGSIGPSRATVLIGTAPMFSVFLAIVLLDEAWSAVTIFGTVLTVAGGALITWNRSGAFVRIGVVLALVTALTFGLRDVVARQVSQDTELGSWWSGAVVLSAAAVVTSVIVLAKERGSFVVNVRNAVPEFVLSGLLIAIALPVLLAALDRGRVGLVAPFVNAVQNVAVLVVGGLVFGAAERSARIGLALILVVAGGALISSA